MAWLYRKQNRFAEAKLLVQRVLAIRKAAIHPDHPDIANVLNNLAALTKSQGRYAEAEPLYLRALAIVEKALGPDHPHVAITLNNLAKLYQAMGDEAKAKEYAARADEAERRHEERNRREGYEPGGTP